MKNTFHFLAVVCAGLVINASAADTKTAPKENVFPAKPLGITLSIKMVGPYMEPADLQIICLFKHKSGGDIYQGAAKETDEKLGGMLSTLRNRGEFVGESGETIVFTPPKDPVLPKTRFCRRGAVRRSESDPSMPEIGSVDLNAGPQSCVDA